jgi:pilus assembly protein CpaE
MSSRLDAELLQRAMFAGARQVLRRPVEPESVARAIRLAHDRMATIRWNAASLAGPATAQAPADGEGAPATGRVVAVFGPKGGVGRTTIATNLAVALRQQLAARVALVDASLMFGDVAILLNLVPPRTIADIVAACPDEPEVEAIEAALVTHPTGVDVLAAPLLPELAETVSAPFLTQLLTKLRKMYNYVVVDTWPTFHDPVLSVLDVADCTIVVSTLEMHAAKNLQLFMRVADALHYPSERMLLVLNRADSGYEVELRDVERRLGRTFAATVSNNWRLAMVGVNEGTPFVVSHPQSQLSQDILRLIPLVTSQPLPPPPAAAPETMKQRLSNWLVRPWSRGMTAAARSDVP